MDILKGKPVKEVSDTVHEAMFCAVYHMRLEEVRELSETDFDAHLPLVEVLFREMFREKLL